MARRRGLCLAQGYTEVHIKHTDKRVRIPAGGLGYTCGEALWSSFGNGTGGANGPECGLFQGNGDIHTSFWNESHELTWSVGKNDVWDRRYYGDRKRIVTLDEIRRLAKTPGIETITNAAPGLPGSAANLYRAYDFPCPKPVGQIILHLPGLEGASEYTAELDMDSALLTVNAAQGDRRIRARGFVSALRNVLVLDLDGTNAGNPVELELYRHRDTLRRGETVMQSSGSYSSFAYDYDQDPDNGPLAPPEAGTDGRFFWIRQRFPAERTFPGGFEAVMMALIPDVDCRVTVRENVQGAGAKVPLRDMPPEEWRITHGAHKEKRKAIQMVNEAPGWLACAEFPARQSLSFTAYVSVMTTRDAADPLAAARRELLMAVKAGRSQLWSEQQEWWNAFWDRSRIEAANEAFTSRAAANTYQLGWSARSGKVPLYNATTPLFADASPWHGDYHFNELWLYPRLIANHAETLLPWLEMLEEMLPMAQANAKDVYGCSGCCYPIIHYPLKSTHVIYANQIWELGLELTAMILKAFWQYARYTGDAAYLRDHAYPILREGARFYADYVRRGEDGCFHIVPTVSQENWGLTRDFRLNRDSVGALSQVKYHLLACVEAATRLGLDEEERSRWQSIAEALAPYPTYDTPEGKVFVDVLDNQPNPKLVLFADLAMVCWGDQIHLESDPVMLETARRTFNVQYRQRPDFRIGEYGHRPHLYRAIERRLGLSRTCAYFEEEDLVQSFTGRIYLFEGVSEGQDARFERLLAWGGFAVSAERKEGKVERVAIESLAGERCRLVNPWPGEPVIVHDASGGPTLTPTLDNRHRECLSFETLQGTTYHIEPRKPA